MALSSCPYPIDMFIRFMSPMLLLNYNPIYSISFIGSIPGKSTKNKGMFDAVNYIVFSISNVLFNTYLFPSIFSTNVFNAYDIQSGLINHIIISLWKSEMSLYFLGSSAFSAFSSETHFHQ